MEFLYRKVGRRYKAVEPFTGFPADGIWLVTRDGASCSCIVRLGQEAPPMEILPYAALKEECAAYISDKAKEKGAYSIMDTAEWSAEFWGEYASGKLPKRDRGW